MNEQITSKQNEKFRLWKSLDESKEIKSNQLCLVSGKKLTQELSKTDWPQTILCSVGMTPDWQLKKPHSTFFLSKDLFAELDHFNTRSPLLVCRTPVMPTLSSELLPQPQDLEIIIATGDPANCGAIIRSAVGFQAKKIILTEDTANPFLPKSIRSSSGAVFSAPLFIAAKTTHFAPFTFLDMSGKNIYSFSWPKSIRLYLGQEGKGISKDLSQNQNAEKISIPISGVESLNVVVAGAVAMSHYRSFHTVSK